MRASTTVRAATAAAPCYWLNAIKVPCTTMQQQATDPEVVLPYYLQFYVQYYISQGSTLARHGFVLRCPSFRPMHFHPTLQQLASRHSLQHYHSLLSTAPTLLFDAPAPTADGAPSLSKRAASTWQPKATVCAKFARRTTRTIASACVTIPRHQVRHQTTLLLQTILLPLRQGGQLVLVSAVLVSSAPAPLVNK